MQQVLVLNGPNLGRLGTREPEIYGKTTYQDLVDFCVSTGKSLGLSVDVRQSDSEAQLIEWIDAAGNLPIILNAAAFTHYSHALRDACVRHNAILIEVHISNPHTREEFRHQSVISNVATGVIAGFGIDSYKLALEAIALKGA
jgi:3-dehydroquinate dehydratase-2